MYGLLSFGLGQVSVAGCSDHGIDLVYTMKKQQVLYPARYWSLRKPLLYVACCSLMCLLSSYAAPHVRTMGRISNK